MVDLAAGTFCLRSSVVRAIGVFFLGSPTRRRNLGGTTRPVGFGIIGVVATGGVSAEVEDAA